VTHAFVSPSIRGEKTLAPATSQSHRCQQLHRHPSSSSLLVYASLHYVARHHMRHSRHTLHAALSPHHSPLAKMKVAVYSSKDYDEKFLTLAIEAQAPEDRYLCTARKRQHRRDPPKLRLYVA
jgi:hypothetical protein